MEQASHRSRLQTGAGQPGLEDAPVGNADPGSDRGHGPHAIGRCPARTHGARKSAGASEKPLKVCLYSAARIVVAGTWGDEPWVSVAIGWGYSSVGRALAWHARGHRFDPGYLHQNLSIVRRRLLSVRSKVLTPSSRGLGHHPFTVSTGVRIPVGSPSRSAWLVSQDASEKLPARSGSSVGYNNSLSPPPPPVPTPSPPPKTTQTQPKKPRAPYPRRVFFIGDALEMSSMIAQNTPCRYRASQASIMVSGVAFDGAIP